MDLSSLSRGSFYYVLGNFLTITEYSQGDSPSLPSNMILVHFYHKNS